MNIYLSFRRLRCIFVANAVFFIVSLEFLAHNVFDRLDPVLFPILLLEVPEFMFRMQD